MAFHKELKYRRVDAFINSYDDAATSCKNLVNFGIVTPDDYEGRVCNFCRELATVGRTYIHSTHLRYKMDCNIATSISEHNAAMIPLHVEKSDEILTSNPRH